MTPALLTLAIRYERDVVLARQRTRQLSALIGFDVQDQTRIATAVSEIARNAFTYAGGGQVQYRIEGTTPPQLFTIEVSDRGPGISNLPAVLSGEYQSPTGMGIGLMGARRLMDNFDIKSSHNDGTSVSLKKILPARVGLLRAADQQRIVDALARQAPSDAFDEVQRQNQELLGALDELNRRKEELVAVNRELEDTNRGVVALYAELDEKADYLRRADELKSRFLSNMSHEFRTPVNSIQALARLLLERSDGELTAEQERQVMFIRKAAEGLGDLVNDLLDIAKVEAGKIVVRPVDVDVAHLMGALRGMLRPLLVNESVVLVFESCDDLPLMHTDEAKLSQILRNFISNALKFTEQGEVRISARHLADLQAVEFSVTDTGIGIAAEDQDRVFQEFTQIDSPIQRRVRGTGLGLPLCRKLAELLGGTVKVRSQPDLGSTFSAVIPVLYRSALPATPHWELDPRRVPVLFVEDSSESLLVYERMLHNSQFQILGAATLREARDALCSFKPRVVVLDILLNGEDAWHFLSELKRQNDAPRIGVLSGVDDRDKALALGADFYLRKPADRQSLLQMLTILTEPESIKSILIVDDEEISRYVLRQHLLTPRHIIAEAASGSEALKMVHAQHFDLICLDLTMPQEPGAEVLRKLKNDPLTSSIPVVIVTSKVLDDAEKRNLLQTAVSILSKEMISRETAMAAIDEAMRGPKAHTLQ